MAAAGFLAVVGQTAAYTYLARYDIAGTSKRSFTAAVEQHRFHVRYPNTWTRELRSTQPEFRVYLTAPGGVWMEIAGSRALLAVAIEEEEQGNALEILHQGLQDRAATGIDHFTEDRPEPSGAMKGQSLVSFFRGETREGPVRGFRFTMLGSEMAWTVVAAGPQNNWSRSVPVLREVIQSLELP